jgi:hypothetical protein
LGLSPDAWTASPNPIFARTKGCIPSPDVFCCLRWKFRLAFSTSLHTPAA